MADIDLVPADYRYRLWQGMILRSAGVVTLGVTAMSLALVLLSGWRSAALNEQIAALDESIDQRRREHEQVQLFEDYRRDLAGRVDRMQRLQGGISLEELLTAIESALPRGELWFTELHLERDDREAIASFTSPTDSNAGQPEPPGVRTRIDINGSALSYEAVTRLTNALGNAPIVADARILQTERNGHQLIDYRLRITGAHDS